MKNLLFAISLIFTLLICGCDPIYTLMINGKSSQTFMNDCGSVELTASTYMGSTFPVTFKFTGENFTANLDSLKISFEDSIEISKIDWYYDGKRVNTRSINIENGKEIEIGVYLKSSLRRSSKFYILPSNFISCQNKQVLKDTLILHQ